MNIWEGNQFVDEPFLGKVVIQIARNVFLGDRVGNLVWIIDMSGGSGGSVLSAEMEKPVWHIHNIPILLRIII